MLLLYSVTLVTLVAISGAVSPAARVKNADNEKDLAAYQYRYEISDEAGDGQGKVEKRDGEHASGRYYVNSDQSSTDVKYFADERGYHPLVKYESANEHSSATARFALGEQALKSLQDEKIRTPQQAATDKKRIQIVQPYTIQKKPLKGRNTENPRKEPHHTKAPAFTYGVSSASTTDFSEGSTIINYINLLENHKITESVSSTGVTPESVTDYLSTLPSDTVETVTSQVTDDVISSILEDQLVIENAGSFGQRVQDQESAAVGTTVSSFSSSDDTFLREDVNNIRSTPKTMRTRNRKQYFDNITSRPNGYSTTPKTSSYNYFLHNVQNDHGQNAIENGRNDLDPGIYSTPETFKYTATTESPYLTKHKPTTVMSSTSKIIELINSNRLNYLPPFEEFNEKKQPEEFSKIQISQPNEKPYQYSTTFKCEDESVSSTTRNPIQSSTFPSASQNDKVSGLDGDTTSSIVLNPIQAGVSLINAGKAHLIGGGSPKPPAPVKEDVKEDVDRVESTNERSQTLQPPIAYENVNPAFGEQPVETNGITPSSELDQEIEIQKSVEIYHNAPVHEINYSDQPTPQVAAIDQQPHGGQQRYVVPPVVLNAKQPFRTRDGTSVTKIYEISEDSTISNYPKLPSTSPIYIVPPATYIIEDKSISKNTLLPEKPQIYALNSNEGDRNANADQQNVQVESTVGANFHAYRSHDNGAGYVRDINQEQQQIAVISSQEFNATESTGIQSSPKPEITNQISPTYNIPVPPQFTHETGDATGPFVDQSSANDIYYLNSPSYPLETIVENPGHNHQPYPIEKVIEKTIPFPQSYPVPYQVPIQQPYHIEKVIERKVPIPVHVAIPQPHLIKKIIEKPVHINVAAEKTPDQSIAQPFPVELPKYVEKPIPHPYGIQYGVSYQQVMRPQPNGLYRVQTLNAIPLYALPSVGEQQNKTDHSHSFQGYIYDKPAIPFIEGRAGGGSKLFSSDSVKKQGNSPFHAQQVPNYPLYNSVFYRRHAAPQIPRLSSMEKAKRDEYVGPVPPQYVGLGSYHHPQGRYGFQSKSSHSVGSERISVPANFRKARHQEQPTFQKGNFRQSKIEYGFKPPMVPSVQYDEESASKVTS